MPKLQPSPDLSDIYKNSGDLSRLEINKRSPVKKWACGILVFLFVVAAATWSGFYFFQLSDGQKFSNEGIGLTVETEKEMVSGNLITYTFNYANRERTDLDNAELDIHYPRGFVFQTSRPTASNPEKFLIKKIKTGETGQITVIGQLVGSENSIQTIDADLIFTPANFHSEFKTAASATTKITSSAIQLKLEGPDRVSGKEEIIYKIKYQNTGENSLSQVKIVAVYPPLFKIKNVILPDDIQAENKRTDADITEGEDSVWIIPLLPTADNENDWQEITVAGGLNLSADNIPSHSLMDFTAASYLPGANNTEDILQQEKKLTTELLRENLLLDLIINGSEQDLAVNAGEPLNYSIIYHNMGDAEINNVAITVNLESDILNWAGLADSYNGITDNHAINWGPEQILNLTKISPNEEGNIDFSIPVKSWEDIDIDNQLKIVSYAEMRIGTTDKPEKSVSSNQITVRLNSRLNLNAEARYFNDDNIPVGSGPLPPQVRETTTYRIYWTINNFPNELADIQVKTVLPQNVTWADKTWVGAGELDFNPRSREIIWEINRLPETVKEVKANFDISITPTEDEVNKLLILLPPPKLSAQDKFSGGEINVTADVVTTDLVNDEMAKGKGIVGM